MDPLEAERIDGGSACHPLASLVSAVLYKMQGLQVKANLAEDHPKGADLKAGSQSEFEVTDSSEVFAAAEPCAGRTRSARL